MCIDRGRGKHPYFKMMHRKKGSPVKAMCHGSTPPGDANRCLSTVCIMFLWQGTFEHREVIGHCIGSTLVQVMACRLYDANPLPGPIMTYHPLHPYKRTWNQNRKNFVQGNDFEISFVEWHTFCLNMLKFYKRYITGSSYSIDNSTCHEVASHRDAHQSYVIIAIVTAIIYTWHYLCNN